MKEWSADAWLLLALHVSGEGRISLDSLIGAADAVNHAIPMYAELDGAARRLSSAGLIDVRENGIALTERGRALVASADAPTWSKTWSALDQALASGRWSGEGEARGIPAAAFDEALAQYAAWPERRH